MIFFGESIINVKSNHSTSSSSIQASAGFSLIEILLVMAIISGLASAAFLISNNIQRDASDTKLMQDVVLVNQAIAVYRASEGTL